MSITDTIKRAPRWAWITVAGVGIGAGAIRLWQNRANPADSTSTDTVAPGDSEYVGSAGSPMPGIVVPPVIIGGTDQGAPGLDALQELYFSGVGTLIQGFQGLYGPVAESMLSQYERSQTAIVDLAMAGGAPQRIAETPVVTAPVPAALPAGCPAGYPTPAGNGGCYKTDYDNRTRDNGKSGSARAVWCNRVTIHRYSDGRPPVVVNETKIKNGAC